METDALLRVDGVEKYFPVTKGLLLMRTVGWVKAVDGISFDIRQGETLALVGESGCGKTTTAKLILHLDEPTAGKVYFEGKDVHALEGDDYKQNRMNVQAVFQDPWSSLSPRMRVRDIVAEPLVANQKLSRQEVQERVEKVLVDVGLNPAHANNYPHEFSGGQRQRIAVASALVSTPKLIVLDEPVSSLDVSIRAQIMNLLRDLQETYNVSYLLIAHDLATTRYMSDKIAVMYLGNIVEYAETEELFTNPKHPYTQALFSAALPSRPDVKREEIILAGEVPSPINPPSGCSFHPRCHKFIGEICRQVRPTLQEREWKGHSVACHLYADGVSPAVESATRCNTATDRASV